MKALGYIVYEGPSELTGDPIVVIVNRVHSRSKNGKTGADLVQTFIIRSDVNPVQALQTGDDAAICGDCVHRPINSKVTGDPPCYVNVGRSVLMVFKAYKRGRYVRVSPQELALILAGRKLRIGTYGDGAAAPNCDGCAAATAAKGEGALAAAANGEEVPANAAKPPPAGTAAAPNAGRVAAAAEGAACPNAPSLAGEPKTGADAAGPSWRRNAARHSSGEDAARRQARLTHALRPSSGTLRRDSTMASTSSGSSNAA